MTIEQERRALRRSRKQRPRVTVVGVLGELLITAGVLVLLFLGWQLWLGNLIAGNSQKDEAVALSETWGKGQAAAPAPVERPDPGPPVVGTAPGDVVRFATMIIPRFGADWVRPVAEGIAYEGSLKYGVGHYPGSQMPGGVGNAAFAAHRNGYGNPFWDIDKLQVGDSIYIEMEVGWYRYVVRSLEYVHPTGVGVLDPVPQAPGVEATDRLITLTSCNPLYTANERFIVYGVYDTWYPRDGGAPPEIASLQASAAG